MGPLRLPAFTPARDCLCAVWSHTQHVTGRARHRCQGCVRDHVRRSAVCIGYCRVVWAVHAVVAPSGGQEPCDSRHPGVALKRTKSEEGFALSKPTCGRPCTHLSCVQPCCVCVQRALTGAGAAGQRLPILRLAVAWAVTAASACLGMHALSGAKLVSLNQQNLRQGSDIAHNWSRQWCDTRDRAHKKV